MKDLQVKLEKYLPLIVLIFSIIFMFIAVINDHINNAITLIFKNTDYKDILTSSITVTGIILAILVTQYSIFMSNTENKGLKKLFSDTDLKNLFFQYINHAFIVSVLSILYDIIILFIIDVYSHKLLLVIAFTALLNTFIYFFRVYYYCNKVLLFNNTDNNSKNSNIKTSSDNGTTYFTS